MAPISLVALTTLVALIPTTQAQSVSTPCESSTTTIIVPAIITTTTLPLASALQLSSPTPTIKDPRLGESILENIGLGEGKGDVYLEVSNGTISSTSLKALPEVDSSVSTTSAAITPTDLANVGNASPTTMVPSNSSLTNTPFPVAASAIVVTANQTFTTEPNVSNHPSSADMALASSAASVDAQMTTITTTTTLTQTFTVERASCSIAGVSANVTAIPTDTGGMTSTSEFTSTTYTDGSTLYFIASSSTQDAVGQAYGTTITPPRASSSVRPFEGAGIKAAGTGQVFGSAIGMVMALLGAVIM